MAIVAIVGLRLRLHSPDSYIESVCLWLAACLIKNPTERKEPHLFQFRHRELSTVSQVSHRIVVIVRNGTGNPPLDSQWVLGRVCPLGRA